MVFVEVWRSQFWNALLTMHFISVQLQYTRRRAQLQDH